MSSGSAPARSSSSCCGRGEPPAQNHEDVAGEGTEGRGGERSGGREELGERCYYFSLNGRRMQQTALTRRARGDARADVELSAGRGGAGRAHPAEASVSVSGLGKSALTHFGRLWLGCSHSCAGAARRRREAAEARSGAGGRAWLVKGLSPLERDGPAENTGGGRPRQLAAIVEKGPCARWRSREAKGCATAAPTRLSLVYDGALVHVRAPAPWDGQLVEHG